MLIPGMKAGRALPLASLLLTALLGWGPEAQAAVPCKTHVQKSSKACAHTLHKKPAAKLKSKSTGKAGTAAPVTAIKPVAPMAAATSASSPGATSPCFNALAASQASQHMAAKVPFFVGQAPGPEVLANTSHPSKKEHEELSSLIAGYQMCHDMSAPAPEGADGSQGPQRGEDQWRASKSILEALRAGKLSYGAAARALDEAGQRN